MPSPLMLAWVGVAFLLGLVVGSGLNVFVYRVGTGRSPLWPSSRCFACAQAIRWHDNVPLLGYLILGGKCRACKRPFSARYLGTELATGVAFAAWFYALTMLDWMRLPGVAEVRPMLAEGAVPLGLWGVWALHAGLFAVALVGYQAARAGGRFPVAVGLFALGAGVVLSVALAWPWPGDPVDARSWLTLRRGGVVAPPAGGAQLWPVVSPRPTGEGTIFRMWLAPGWLTALAGATVAWVLLTLGRFRDGGARAYLVGVGALFGWQFVLPTLLLVGLLTPMTRSPSAAAALAPPLMLVAWPLVAGGYYRLIAGVMG